MPLHIDPAGEETRALAAATNWQNKLVLEIGCGDGRLTLRLASLRPARIEALDPDPALVESARKNLPRGEKRRVRFHVGQAEGLKYKPGTFDTVIFSWAL